MNLVSNISELDFYNTPSEWDCYCEQLAYPSDLVLQDYINTYSNSGFDVKIYVMSADGLTEYEDATTDFSWYVFQVGNSRLYNLRLNSYSASMCQYLCWILRVEVSVDGDLIYRKWTNRYCQTSCCDAPRGISYEVSGYDDNLVLVEQSTIPVGQCGSPLIRIEAFFECVNNQTGEYFGFPSNVLTGPATFSFTKITNITGKIQQKPSDITRIISYNCQVQRSESFEVFDLQSEGVSGTFPAWKLKELQGMFHAQRISISDFYQTRDYQFQGGPIAIVPNDCWDIYRLKATLQSCVIRQTFGCNESCETVNALSFLIPMNYAGNGFYSEDLLSLGDYDSLKEYYSAYGEVTETSYDNTYNSFTVTGEGYIPTNFYYDNTSFRNRVYGNTNPVAPVIGCIMPALGTPQTYELTCETPVLGEEQTYASDMGEAIISDLMNWDVEENSSVILSDMYGKMNLETANNVIIETSPLTYLTNEPIGKIQPNGAPSFTQTFDSSSNPSIPVDSYVTIDTTGTISYSGYPTSYDGEVATITITDLYYLL